MRMTLILIFTVVYPFFSIAQRSTQGDFTHKLTPQQQQYLKKLVKKSEPSFDSLQQMMVVKLSGYQYHTDASSGNYHQVRASIQYALAMLNTEEVVWRNRAMGVIRKTISLQDTDPQSRTCGVWPYYLEEPLQTKKSPPDFNMADFNAVTLIEVWMNHAGKFPPSLQDSVKQSIRLAARCIMKRQVDPGYTNIAIMGTYVTYMAGQILNDSELKTYADRRLLRFYQYTMEKKGFTEYNSPNYTITALEDLNRLQLYMKDKQALKMVDSLYNLCWDMIARHYHPASGQWSGPHSRNYSSIIGRSFYNLLHEASEGKLHRIDSSIFNYSTYARNEHRMPARLLPYFIHPTLPRIEVDVFEPDTPQVIGTSYLTERYTLSTCNHASLWNQRRPLIGYWGTVKQPSYFQVRFLHDEYDFSSASLSAVQQSNQVMAMVNFNLGLGDKHIHIDKLKEGRFTASDLRLRFEFGNASLPPGLSLPQSLNQSIALEVGGIFFNIRMFEAVFGNYKGYWQVGGNGKNSWIDYVLYSGTKQEFDLTKIGQAALGFTLEMDTQQRTSVDPSPRFVYNGTWLQASWKQMELSVDTKVNQVKKHGGWY